MATNITASSVTHRASAVTTKLEATCSIIAEAASARAARFTPGSTAT